MIPSRIYDQPTPEKHNQVSLTQQHATHTSLLGKRIKGGYKN